MQKMAMISHFSQKQAGEVLRVLPCPNPSIMTLDDKHKIEENLRFFIESTLWKFEIDNKVQIQSFTVHLQNGAVKSVKIKTNLQKWT